MPIHIKNQTTVELLVRTQTHKDFCHPELVEGLLVGSPFVLIRDEDRYITSKKIPQMILI
jgi:hypothetical protein